MPPADVLALASRYRAALEAQDAAALARIIAAYTQLFKRLSGAIDALGLELAEAGTITRGQLLKMQRYADLLEQVGDELTRFSGFVGVEMGGAARAAIEMAQIHAAGLVNAAVGVSVKWNALPTDTIEALLGFLDPRGPLYARLAELAPATVKAVAQTIIDNIAMGRNPRAWANLLRDKLGIPLTDALRMTRTVQLYSYRESTRAGYAANEGIVSGWRWYAKLDGDVCMSCAAQHGSLHPNSETLNDHHNGRCAMLPEVAGFAPLVTEGAGKAWFDSLPADQQAALMGKGKHDAYTAGAFDFGALSKTHTDGVYGDMRVETPLKELVGT